MRCTWVDCQDTGLHAQLDRDGRAWSTLCEAHKLALDQVMVEGNVKKIISSWIKASGGSRAMMR